MEIVILITQDGILLLDVKINNGIQIDFGFWIGNGTKVTLPLAFTNAWFASSNVVSAANGQLSSAVLNKTLTTFVGGAYINNNSYAEAGCNYIGIGY